MLSSAVLVKFRTKFVQSLNVTNHFDHMSKELAQIFEVHKGVDDIYYFNMVGYNFMVTRLFGQRL